MRNFLTILAPVALLACTDKPAPVANNDDDAAVENVAADESVFAPDDANMAAAMNATDGNTTDHGVTDHGVTDHGVTDHGVTDH